MKIAESYARALEQMARDGLPYLAGREYDVAFSRNPQGFIAVHIKVEGNMRDPEPGLLDCLDALRRAIEQHGLTVVYTKSGRHHVEYETLSKHKTVEEFLRANGLLMKASLYSMSARGANPPPKANVLVRCVNRVAGWFGLPKRSIHRACSHGGEKS